jgi:hypothetical protein
MNHIAVLKHTLTVNNICIVGDITKKFCVQMERIILYSCMTVQQDGFLQPNIQE